MLQFSLLHAIFSNLSYYFLRLQFKFQIACNQHGCLWNVYKIGTFSFRKIIFLISVTACRIETILPNLVVVAIVVFQAIASFYARFSVKILSNKKIIYLWNTKNNNKKLQKHRWRGHRSGYRASQQIMPIIDYRTGYIHSHLRSPSGRVR